MLEENQLVKHLFQHQESQDMVDFTDFSTPTRFVHPQIAVRLSSEVQPAALCHLLGHTFRQWPGTLIFFIQGDGRS